MNAVVWLDGNGHVVQDGPYRGRSLRKYRDRVYDIDKKDFVPGWKIDILCDAGWQCLCGAKEEEAVHLRCTFLLSGT